jgi:hypothetical protein
VALVTVGHEIAEDGVRFEGLDPKPLWLGTGWVEKRISPLRCSQKREQLRSKGQLFGGAEEEQTTATAVWLVERLLSPQRDETAIKEHRAPRFTRRQKLILRR